MTANAVSAPSSSSNQAPMSQKELADIMKRLELDTKQHPNFCAENNDWIVARRNFFLYADHVMRTLGLMIQRPINQQLVEALSACLRCYISKKQWHPNYAKETMESVNSLANAYMAYILELKRAMRSNPVNIQQDDDLEISLPFNHSEYGTYASKLSGYLTDFFNLPLQQNKVVYTNTVQTVVRCIDHAFKIISKEVTESNNYNCKRIIEIESEFVKNAKVVDFLLNTMKPKKWPFY